MVINRNLLNDDVYNRLLNKFKNGIFSEGEEYNTQIYVYQDGIIPPEPIALGMYIDGIETQKIEIEDVPKKYRTYEFYVHTFYYTYDYIKNHIKEFNRDFFKKLICNGKETIFCFDKNCFTLMPLEYIDEEMVSLAVLNSHDWVGYNWLLTVNERKPDAISEDVWKLAARLYGGRSFTNILNIVPEKYKDEEWYLELFKCQFGTGKCRIDSRDVLANGDKTVLMDFVPQEILTPEFLIKLFKDDPKNIARFNEKALETKINVTYKRKKYYDSIWKVALTLDGHLVDYMDLNEERVLYFKSHFDRDSSEYYTFKYCYRDYKRSKKKKTDDNNVSEAAMLDAVLFAAKNSNYSKEKYDDVVKLVNDIRNNSVYLPVFYQGSVPEKYCKRFDSEEYLAYIYEKMGITILDDSDYLLYKVLLPEKYHIDFDGYTGKIIDDKGRELIEYFRCDKFYDRSAYVSYINPCLKNKTEYLKKDYKINLD